MTENISSPSVDETLPVQNGTDEQNLSLSQLRNLIRTEHLNRLMKELQESLQDLTKGQKQVQFLHKLMKAINLCYDIKKQKLNISQELKDILSKGNENEDFAELIKEVGLDNVKDTYSREEKERIVENCNWSVQDLNMVNDAHIQKTQRLTNERLEIYQLLRTTEKPFSDAILSMARQVATR